MFRQAELPFFSDRPTRGETARTIALGDRIVPYTLRRSSRRSIGLTIDQRGLRVGAPHRASLSEIERMILKHADWVTSKLDEWRTRRLPAVQTLTDGTRLPYLGGWLELRLAQGSGRAEWTSADDVPVLTLKPRTERETATLLVKALQGKARTIFGERLATQAERFGIAPPRFALSSARTRWGSCSLKTGIRLNWRLIHGEAQLIDYVIVHELAHLSEMNHSPRFWAIVERHFPAYRAARTALKQLSGTLPEIA